MIGQEEWIRTTGPLPPKQVLYPAELLPDVNKYLEFEG